MSDRETSPIGVNFLQVVFCPKREGHAGHCLHLTGSSSRFGQVVERSWRCCYCGEDSTETIKPLRDLPTSYQAAPHGPFAPTFHVLNSTGAADV